MREVKAESGLPTQDKTTGTVAFLNQHADRETAVLLFCPIWINSIHYNIACILVSGQHTKAQLGQGWVGGCGEWNTGEKCVYCVPLTFPLHRSSQSGATRGAQWMMPLCDRGHGGGRPETSVPCLTRGLPLSFLPVPPSCPSPWCLWHQVVSSFPSCSACGESSAVPLFTV